MHVTLLLCKDGTEKAHNFGWVAFRYCSLGDRKKCDNGIKWRFVERGCEERRQVSDTVRSAGG